MPQFGNLSIQTKLLVIILATCTVALLVTGAAFMGENYRQSKADLIESLDVQARIVGANSTAAIVFGDAQAATETLGALRSRPEIVYARIATLDEPHFAIYRTRNSISDSAFDLSTPGHRVKAGHMEVLAPIELDQGMIGQVHLAADMSPFAKRLNRALLQGLLVFLVALGAAWLVAQRLQRSISAPIQHLSQIAHWVSREKNYTVRAIKTHNDELGELVENTNEMLTQIERRDDMLKAHRSRLEADVANRTRDLHRLTERLRHQAYHDSLTNLANRAQLNEYLAEAIEKARAANEHLALLYMDIDRFKLINDSLGHELGDILLQRFGQRIQDNLRSSDIVARLGGDEFVAVLRNTGNSDAIADLVGELMAALREPYTCGEHSLHVTPSIGIALFPEDAQDPATLLRQADSAMYRVKQSGRNGARFFSEEMLKAGVQRLDLESALHHALPQNQFQLYYQPVLRLADKKPVAVEALLRWQHPTLGLQHPNLFIGLAEEAGLIGPIGEWALRKACADMQEWADQGLDDIGLSVNVSPKQIQARSFASSVQSILQDSQLPAQRLTLEITENLLLENFDDSEFTLSKLKALGVSMAVDDFGIGYSNLKQLTSLPFNTIKLDRSLLNNDEAEPKLDVVHAVVKLGHALDMQVTAEGVETLDMLGALESAGCDMAQGFVIAAPRPGSEIPQLFRQWTPDKLGDED